MEAHAPRTPSLRARRRVMPEEMVERSLIVDQRNGTLLAYTFGRHRYTDEEIAVIQGVYDASLVELDEATGDLLDALADRGLLDDTIVVLTSDHGEHLGDHRLFGHRFSLYDALVRVPLVVRYPARLPPGRVERTVSLLDLRPTLLDLAGVRGAATEESSRSLFAPVAAESVPVFSELDQVAPGFVENAARRYPDLDWTPWLRTCRAAVADGFKLIRASDGQRQLFETAVDPAETRDVAAARPQVAARLEAAIDGWLASFDHYDRASATDEPPPLAPALGEKLKALGYIDDEG